MKTTLLVYANYDDALLLWTADELPDDLEGFSIQRKLKRGDKPEETTWLDNYAPPGVKVFQNGQHAPSDTRPFRSFAWTDHGVDLGDRVRYRVVPFLRGTTAPTITLASAWSRSITLAPPRGGAKYRAFFNRGFVISQFVSRYLDETYPAMDRLAALAAFKADISAHVDSVIRRYLSGEVRTNLLALLDEVKSGDQEVYAALFELNDPELVGRLVALGKRAHVVLANGSIEVKKDKDGAAKETSAEARKRDENKDARKRLLDAGVDVDAKNRFVSPGALAHNKFLVVVDKSGKPRRAWTGSTNWTTTGLCTQLNNALLIDDADVAAAYLAQWHELRDAHSAHPNSLPASNATPTDIGGSKRKTVRSSVQFTRAPEKVDLTELGDVVRSAKEGVLFLMFIPGPSGVLKDVFDLQQAKPQLLIRGVVSQLPNGRQDEKSGSTTTVKVTVVGAPNPTLDGTRTYDVVQPQGKAHTAAWWAVETTRSQFLSGIGFAIIHSKVLVIDPFSDDPTVVTGSHNFSGAASTTNDENFIIVRGERALAEAYAVNIDSAWRHYASRAGNPYKGITGIDYLRAVLADQRREEPFWRLA
jgi:phosphatidylserine/phosphatidylglycerophosphate/cardiolipin synthase-like enzyme